MVRWRTEDPDLDAAARDYEAALRAGASAPWLDLALLGLGPDGHTASLFPGTSALAEEDRLAVAVDVAQMGTRRLTLTYPALCGAREVCFLVTGPDKAAALADGRRGRSSARRADRAAARSRDHILRSATPPAPHHRFLEEMTVLAGDIGGTNARLAIYDVGAGRRRSAPPLFEKTYPSRAYPSLDVIVDEFAGAATAKIGADRQGGARLLRHRRPDREQHVPRHQPPLDRRRARRWPRAWGSRGSRWSTTSTPPRWASRRSAPASWWPSAAGRPCRTGRSRCSGAGTGLGQAFLLWSAADNAYQVVPSEGGHVDLAARTPLELGLVQFLITKYGRVSCERVLSGHGLVDVFTFLSEEPACRGLIRPETAAALAAHGAIRRRRSRNGRWPGPIRSARWRCQFSVPSWAPRPGTWGSWCWRRAVSSSPAASPRAS